MSATPSPNSADSRRIGRRIDHDPWALRDVDRERTPERLTDLETRVVVVFTGLTTPQRLGILG
jgi:hypothetical protein